ncbi:MAG: Imidazolonepropionase [Phycisphaerae bacterium]|nr:Imidazolonepropionase [Phycisphaerae bacterium]
MRNPTQRGQAAGSGVLIALLVASSVLGASAWGQDDPSGTTVIKVRRVYTAAGEPIEHGMVVVRDGRIVAVGADLKIPEGAATIDLGEACLTPGLIDAHAAIDSEIPDAAVAAGRRRGGMWEQISTVAQSSPQAPLAAADADGCCGGSAAEVHEVPCPHQAGMALPPTCEGICPHCGQPVAPAAPPGGAAGFAEGVPRQRSFAEQASEVTPHLRVADTLNLFSTDFTRLMREGVTTVWVSPDSASVIGMRGAVVKTAGAAGKRVVRAADAVKASMGGDSIRRGAGNQMPRPSRGGGVTFMTRRPTTRMGVAWVFRKAFYDARRAAAGGGVSGADSPPAPAIDVLLAVLSGDVPLRIQARMQHDIMVAIELANELRIGGESPKHGYRFILEEGTEAYQCLAELKSAGIPVIFGPIFDTPRGYRGFGEANDPRLTTATQLRDAGIRFALTANDLREEEGLARQAMMAMRFGLTRGEALRAVTAVPAELLGLKGSVGTIEEGAAADLVAWNGEPFAAESRPLWVMVDGAVVMK